MNTRLQTTATFNRTKFGHYYRAMLRRARLWDCVSSVCASVCLFVTFMYY